MESLLSMRTCGEGTLSGMASWMSVGQTRTVYQWLRIEQFDQWWHWGLLLTICVAVGCFIVWWYRRDAVEQRRPVGWALMLLRAAAFVGLLLYFFQFDKRSEQRVVRDSRVAVLIDTSMSMSLPGTPSEAGVPSSLSRSEEVQRLLDQSPLLEQLRQQHRVSLYRFDSGNRPATLAAYDKQGDSAEDSERSAAAAPARQLEIARRVLLAAGALGAIAALCLLVSWGAQIGGWREWSPGGWLLLTGACLALLAGSTTAYAIVTTTEYPLAAVLGFEVARTDQPEAGVAGAPGSRGDSQAGSQGNDDGAEGEANRPLTGDRLADALNPQGVETRLGDAIKAVMEREIGNPLAGIVLLTDGRGNAGLAPRNTIITAQNARVPLMIVGLGSESSPPNVQLAELDVPQRLYPGDRFSLRALVGSHGYAGKTVTVQISSGAVDAEADAMTIEAEQEVTIPDDNSLAEAEFELAPKAVGEWKYSAEVISLSGDADEQDNRQEASVEVIERKNRVLILAGGPTREYQFVRNLLYRDTDVESHVLLQTGGPMTSQEAQELLEEFPASRTELSNYDAVIAFDADWTAIPEAGVQAMEQWVAEQAGGFVLVAGPVEMPKWVARSASGVTPTLLRTLSPVVLDRRGSSLLASGRVEAETPWPLTVTPDGRQTEFLNVAGSAEASAEVWERFEGVHTFYSAYELKPGAKALALFSDPASSVDGQLPIYLASHFYGSGRVVFQGGGELWRMRSLDEGFFERYYTNLMRWVSQGRLLLDSDRGVLLVDRERAVLGEQVSVRAVLKNERYEPLIQNEVVARLIDPAGRNFPLTLRPLTDGSQPGVYSGQFPVLTAGEYRVQLQLGGIASDEVLSNKVQARVPAKEMQDAQRHDTLLSQLASETEGRYWKGARAAAESDAQGRLAVAAAIAPRDQVAFLPGTTDHVFRLRWLGWLMAWIAGCLTIEWLSRRFHRLA